MERAQARRAESLWESKIELGEDFFNEIISHPVPLDMNTLTALKRSALGLDLYLWLVYRTFTASRSATAHLAAVVPAVRTRTRIKPATSKPSNFRRKVLRELKKIKIAWPEPELRDGSGRLDPASLNSGHRSVRSRSASKLISPFRPQRLASDGLSSAGLDV